MLIKKTGELIRLAITVSVWDSQLYQGPGALRLSTGMNRHEIQQELRVTRLRDFTLNPPNLNELW